MQLARAALGQIVEFLDRKGPESTTLGSRMACFQTKVKLLACFPVRPSIPICSSCLGRFGGRGSKTRRPSLAETHVMPFVTRRHLDDRTAASARANSSTAHFLKELNHLCKGARRRRHALNKVAASIIAEFISGASGSAGVSLSSAAYTSAARTSLTRKSSIPASDTTLAVAFAR